MSTTKLEIKTFPRFFKGPITTHRTPKKSKRFTDHLTLSPYNMIPGSSGAVKKKRELFPGQWLPLSSSLTLPYESESLFRNFSLIPFHPWGQPELSIAARLSPSNAFAIGFRIDSLMMKCSSHETFLHFGLQGSRLNICYYHQDLH